jgi:hypothetical protein
VVETDILFTLAEVAVAFAGFSSLVAVLGQKDSLDDLRVLGVRMRAMLLTSLAVVGFAILPALLSRYGLAPREIWRLASIGLLLTSCGFVAWTRVSLRTLDRTGVIRTRLQRFLIVPTVALVNAGLLVSVAVNVFLASSALYVTGLVLLLFQSGFTFTHIVFSFLPPVENSR